jgi:predicted nucleic acid-binding protein
MVILADTSAWIEYLRATGSSVHRRLAELVAADTAIAVTEPVLMELLIGARNEADELRLRRLLARFDLVNFDSLVDFEVATRIYQRCRRDGLTPRGLIDCLIAAVAWRSAATLLTNDRGLIRIAGVIGIALDPAVPTAT